MLSDKRIKRYLSMAKSASELSDYIYNKVGCIFVYKKDHGFTKKNKYGSRQAIWYCKCDCGNYRERQKIK